MGPLHDADAALPALEARELEARARRASARLRRRLDDLDARLAAMRTEDERRFAADAAREAAHMLARVDLHIALARARADGEMVEIDPRMNAFFARMCAAEGGAEAMGRPAR